MSALCEQELAECCGLNGLPQLNSRLEPGEREGETAIRTDTLRYLCQDVFLMIGFCCSHFLSYLTFH